MLGSEMSHIHDAIIFGAGPAGVSCALELHENKINYLLVDKEPDLAAQLARIPQSITIRNYLGGFWQSGAALRDDIEAAYRRLNARAIEQDEILQADLKEKVLVGRKHTYRARTIFIGSGVRMRTINIAGAESIPQRVLHDAEGRENDLRGKKLVIVGGGDNAVMDANALKELCQSIAIVHRGPPKARPDVIREATNDARIQFIANSEIVRVESEAGALESVTVKDLKTNIEQSLAADFVLVRVGWAPNTELFANQLALSPSGYVKVDISGQTSMPGIFAGGDVAEPECLSIAKSVGQGAVAARAMARLLWAAEDGTAE